MTDEELDAQTLADIERQIEADNAAIIAQRRRERDQRRDYDKRIESRRNYYRRNKDRINAEQRRKRKDKTK